MKKIVSFFVWLFSISAAFSALQTPIDFNFTFDGTNTVQVAWNAYPGKSYVLQTTTNLAGPWSNSSTLVATSNSLAFSFPTTAKSQFFKVVKLDTEGPDISPISPLDGAIAVGSQSPVQVQLTDATGINTNSIILTVGTNPPVSLPNPQLAYAGGLLIYTPATNVFLGTNGQIVVATISVADTLGNQTTNFTWSFQIALPSVPVANMLIIPGSSGFVLTATNGNLFTYSYTGSFPGLTVGEVLVNTNLATGYTLTVLSFTNYPDSNTVDVLTRPTTLAEMLQLGSISSANFTQLGSQGNAAVAFNLKGAVKKAPTGRQPLFGLKNTANLQGTLYQDANVLIELLSDSQLTLDSDLAFGANFNGLKLRQFSATLNAGANFTLDAHVHATGALDRSGTTPLITPVHQFYGAFVGAVPVWVELVLEINAGYNLHLTASADYSSGITGANQILTGRSWTETGGWTTFWQNPPGGYTVLGPTWQLETTGSLRVYLQPKLTLYVYSAAGVSGDLEPYLELDGNAQLNPQQWDLELNGGLTSTIGLDLRVWNNSWGALPDQTFDLIPSTLLWEMSSSTSPPQITSQPSDQWVTAGGNATFTVAANGPGTLTYRWQRNGLYLTDDSRINGTRSSTLQITHCSTNDIGSYRVVVGNPNGTLVSQGAWLIVYPATNPVNPITFLVDMNSQSSAIHVYVRGSFNNWGFDNPLTNQLLNNGYGIYTNTVNIQGIVGTNIQFKFYYEPGANWEQPASTCGENRMFTINSGPQTLPLIYWNDEPLGSPKIFVTFQVDMTQEINSGAFTNGISDVRVSGDFNNWGSGNLMANNPALVGSASNIYTAVIMFPNIPVNCHQYKFRENGGWETPTSGAGNPNNNRSLFLVGGNQVLPLVFYNQ